jgi:hypothetical protein
MKENNRGAQKGGEQISSFQPKKKTSLRRQNNTQYKLMMMIMRRDRSYYNQHVL